MKRRPLSTFVHRVRVCVFVFFVLSFDARLCYLCKIVIAQADMFSALELETMGKVVDETPSDARRRRLAVYESAKAILVELLPSLETVELVTVVPREKQPDGQLRLEFNEARTRCGTFSRQYLHEQMVAVSLCPRYQHAS